MSNIPKIVTDRMDYLQVCMESNKHLDDPAEVLDIIDSVSKFWPILSEEDKDYIHCAQYAIEKSSEWNV